uniref:Uncharacterized protein n=1 Tax=Avena sativa TaxID=4498 RepID=A0ACD5Z6X6_AVESA
MRRKAILLVAAAVAICAIGATAATARDVDGGWGSIQDIDDPEIQAIGLWAVTEHVKQAGDGLKFKKVLSGSQQTVAGQNYRLVIDAVKGDLRVGKYIAEVFDQSWTHTRKLTSFAPAN